ncbi:macro domain-containing protein [Pseudogracilibacillus sp. SO30301A]
MNDFKVIPFNEFFDTIVDGKVSSRHSLHGKYF